MPRARRHTPAREVPFVLDHKRTSMTSQRTILIVDDEAAITRGLSLRLRAAGYRTIVAFDGVPGLAAAIEHLPDAVILDARLPTMDGTQFLRRMQEIPETRTIPVIVLSGAGEEQKAALEAGAYSFLLKPYERESMLAAVRDAVEHRLVALKS
jgi:DNA-binding response OmpR family regulator